jgi:hypothetical protein
MSHRIDANRSLGCDVVYDEGGNVIGSMFAAAYELVILSENFFTTEMKAGSPHFGW